VEAWRLYAEQVVAERWEQGRLADGDTVHVAGYPRYADLLPTSPPVDGTRR
jgi:hypothetical protein